MEQANIPNKAGSDRISDPPPPPTVAEQEDEAPKAGSAPKRLVAGTELQHKRYRIEKAVAKGGMGAVYQAYDQHFKKTCAVKEMLDNFSNEEERQQSLQWFEREANMLLELHHQVIPRVFDFFAENGHNYLVMEFVDGRTLAQVLEDEGQPRGLPEARVRSWAVQICNVLAYLHSQNPPVIFRDLKPSNIMVTSDDKIKLIDFGIARSFEGGGRQATVIMTLGYAPPEQLEGKPQPQSDIFALGATLHRLLTRHEANNNKPSIFDFPTIRTLRPEITPFFDGVIGPPIYAQTTFPVVAADRVVIPAGTYVEGAIEKLTRPKRRSNRAQIEMLFTSIVFANGYVVSLPALGTAASTPDNAPSLVDVAVQVSPSNDLLLDNGAQVEITLAAPLVLDAAQTAAAMPLSHAPDPGQFKPASLCRPTAGTPGSPGTPDTVIPGTPSTPDTVIPGGPGMPDTVIPGSPGTPDTVIPGSPGTPGFPGRSCASPPMVISSTPVNANSPANRPPGQAPAPPAAH